MDDLQEPMVAGYSTGRLLGSGGSASVWLATEQRTGREVALKCFREPGGTASGRAMNADAIRREIRILSVLDHQHLVRAHSAVIPSAGAGAGTAALIMDYAPGGSLAGLVAARGRIGVGETVTVLTPIAQALAYLHGKGFTHSDVSPGNVLFTVHGKPLLSDVGLARMLGDPAAAGPAGTPGFQDPAPVDAVRAGLQPERDVYSVAALGWFCLTGRAPARTLDRMPLSLLVPEVPADLAAILEAGLSEDRRLRPTAAALATAVYRSAAAAPLDLSSSVHPSVIPHLLTRRPAPEPSRKAAAAARLGNVRRRLATLGRDGTGARIPFPAVTRQPGDGQPVRDFPAPVAPDLPAVPKHPAVRGRHTDRARGGRRLVMAGQRQGRGPRLWHQPRAATGTGTRRRAGATLRTAVIAAATCAAVVAGLGLAALGLGATGPLGIAGARWPGSTGPAWILAPTASPGGAASPADQGSGAAADSSAAPEPNAAADSNASNAAAGPPGASDGPNPAANDEAFGAARGLATEADPARAIMGLAALRDQAFRTQQPGLLAGVNAPGSAAAATDTLIMDGLLAAGRRLSGFTSTLTDVAAEPGPAAPAAPEGPAAAPPPPGGRAVVGATVATSAYSEVDAQGSVLAAVPAGEGQRLRVVLVELAGSWRVSEILAGG
ncbi:serine/threonine-protein kinase [Pseudarthrobacter sp. MEB009]|uniref:serine/threonine-protein kinase n=1 Tax=Pseudarthrobacter sp. MEB009 TaxID=3040326 RepID=UPI0025574B20|nr:serine/threonine-protein kinase [Pseudarthrobacter sp. MEB009]